MKKMIALMLILLGTAVWADEYDDEYEEEEETPAQVAPPAPVRRPAAPRVVKPMDPSSRMLGLSANLAAFVGGINEWRIVYMLTPGWRTGLNLSYSSTNSKTSGDGSNFVEDITSSMGLSVFGAMEFPLALPTYAGLALGYGSSTQETKMPAPVPSPAKVESSAITIGLLGGTEYKFNPSLALGVEAGLNYVMESPAVTAPATHEITNIDTYTAVWLTWYFM